MNRWNIQNFNLVVNNNVVNDYGETGKGVTVTISGNLVEKETYMQVDNAKSLIGNYEMLTSYKYCKPGQELWDSEHKYLIKQVINSTRFAQLVLIRLA